MPAVRFFDETIIQKQSPEDDGGRPVTHLLIETGVSPTHKPVRLATDQDRADYGEEFRAYERAKRPSKPCEHCDGTGSVIDEEAERAMEKEKKDAETAHLRDADGKLIDGTDTADRSPEMVRVDNLPTGPKEPDRVRDADAPAQPASPTTPPPSTSGPAVPLPQQAGKPGLPVADESKA